MYFKCYILFILFLLGDIQGLRILGIFQIPIKSHFVAFEPIMVALAEKGHEVTVISHFPLDNPPKNYKDISLKGTVPPMTNAINFDDLKMKPFLGLETILYHIGILQLIIHLGNASCTTMMQDKNIQNLQKGQYDLAIIELFGSDCGAGIAAHLDLNFIGITSHSLMPWTPPRLGIPDNPSYFPNHFLGSGRYPGFFETIESLLINVCQKIVHTYVIQARDQEVMKKHYGEDFPKIGDLVNNIGLVLATTYFPLTGAFNLPPNYIEIGGITLGSPKPLPTDLKKYVEDSKDGVIVFSMGSMLKAISWPNEKLKAFQQAFSKLPYNILWKWENDTMVSAPANVKISKWLPQFDLMCHPNVKLFIGHGGLGGVTESIHCGVPTLLIPVYGDQPSNAAAVRDSGAGITLDYYDITEESVRNALQQALKPSYRENTKKLSALWKDRLNSPLETAVYWIEHAAKYGGKHLRPVTADLPFYRYLLLDVIAFFSLIGLTFSFITIKVLKCVFGVGSKKPKVKKN